MYREGIPALRLSLEQGTDVVPNDGQWHIVFDGEVVASFASEKKARAEYRQRRDLLVAETGFQTSFRLPTSEEVLRREALDRELSALQAEARRSKRAKAVRRGGKGGSGGIGA